MEAVQDVLVKFLGAGSRADLPAVLIAHLNIVLYAFCFWMCQPVLPFLTKSLGVDKVMFGWLQTAFSVTQFVGSPIIGRICDVYGAKVALVSSQLGSAAHYAGLGVASSVPLLFLAQLPTVLQHCMLGAQAALSAYTTREARAAAMGRLFLSYGVGMVGGSALGGTLSKATSNSTVAFLAAALSVFAGAVTTLALPSKAAGSDPADDDADDKSPAAKKKGATPASGLNLQRIVQVLSKPALRDIIVVTSLFGLASHIQHKTFSIVAPEKFHVDQQDLGFVMSFGGLVGVATNAGLVGPITSRLSDKQALFGASIGLCLSYLAYGTVNSLYSLCALFVPMTLCSTILYNVQTAAITKMAGDDDAGSGIGLSHGTRTFFGIIAPTLGGYLLDGFGVFGIGVTCAGLCAAAAVIISQLRDMGSAGAAPPATKGPAGNGAAGGKATEGKGAAGGKAVSPRKDKWL